MLEQINAMKPIASTDMDALTVIPVLNNLSTITELKQELPSYLAKADDIYPLTLRS